MDDFFEHNFLLTPFIQIKGQKSRAKIHNDQYQIFQIFSREGFSPESEVLEERKSEK